MTDPVRFEVSAESSSGLLCRLLGLLAQLDMPAPELSVKVEDGHMTFEATLIQFVPELVPVLAGKMARFVGVHAVRFEDAET